MEDAWIPHFSQRLYLEVKLLRYALGDLRAKDSLEIGAGYGRLTPWIAEFSAEHHAVEANPRFTEIAKVLYPGISFHTAKAQKLPFSDARFDLAVSWTVLQHIPPKLLPSAVSELKRVSTPGSTILLCESVSHEKGILGGESNTWGREVAEWSKFLKPWQLDWQLERALDGKLAGMVMRCRGPRHETISPN